MHTFDYEKSGHELLTPKTVNLLNAVHEAKGRQNVQLQISPDLAEPLVSVARIQSTDASNRIEGISTTNKRLAGIVSEKVAPRNRDEEEIAGYRDVLKTIHENYAYIPLKPNVILQLHRDLFRHTPLAFAGHWKDTDNMIVESDGTGHARVRFTPPSALQTPELMAAACSDYNKANDAGDIDSLLLTCMFVFDFTCIHPFNDGNGRMSRLLTLLLLYRSGYEIGKYISIEHLIEQSKATYYEALAASTAGWNENTNDYAPFVNYLLSTILVAYREFDERAAAVSTPISLYHPTTKKQRIADVLNQSLSPLSKADIQQTLPDISTSTIERTLKTLLNAGQIQKLGAGRSTRYVSLHREKK
ncbi:Fic family protein [Bifidobacterium sp. ESL0728]|uniref:Fic family protein n=1 Tax=Bifidobacterium sp. ESL0728 TaxID=2983220 RepID=UPI0023F656CA|nr:Fic family protein [Bifidobacterium sp. ESL0728]WEV59040.1 Fic family protein [Bifidobacterium sp. ESL0728]